MKKTKQDFFVQVCVYLVLILITVVTLLPLVWMFSASFKLDSEVFSVPIQ